ncbi:MAG: hypothetical protein LBQ40_03295 [Clostridiales bacterium]|jgi:O-glycosyl hydrolase|nr:hypothetical protein [Clostridiales bacterium]
MKQVKAKGRVAGVLKAAVIVCVAAVWFFGTYAAAVTVAGVTLSVDSDVEYQTLEGFGASAAWTFQSLGGEDDETVAKAAEMLYGDSGLALSIFRYNIGAGSAEPIFDGVFPYNSGWFDGERRAESFFKAENYKTLSDFADEGNYDFTKDAQAMRAFEKCMETGNVERLVLFANSPHYLMTESGKTTGDYEYQNNLREDSYGAFCDYLLIIAKNFYTSLAAKGYFPRILLSPINEPQWKWGGESASQEGCHYDPKPLAAFADVFFKKLKAFNEANGLSIEADLFECGNYKIRLTGPDILDYLDAMSKYEYFDEMTHISVHSYGANTDKIARRGLSLIMKKYPNLKVSQTEVCEMEWGRFDTIESGLFLGKMISRDLTYYDATDWSWWLGLARGDYNDGLVYWDIKDGVNELSVLKRYYVMGHYTKYLGIGDKRVGVSSSDFVNMSGLDYSAFKKADGSIVLIVINEGLDNKITVKANGSSATVVTTSATQNQETFSLDFSGSLKLNLKGKSITTVVLR